MRRIDLTGKKFGRLTVLNYAETNERGEAKWLCRCDCGTEKVFFGTGIKYGKTKSCGCLHKEITSGKNNYQAKLTIKRDGIHLGSNDEWYVRAMTTLKRARENNLPIGFSSITSFAMYLKEIAPEKCPVFGELLSKGAGGISHKWSPSVDKIIPELGYIKGNIQVISYLANAMKRDTTLDQLEKFALWALDFVARVKKMRGENA